ncbi:hypothetical protein FEM48_Zijuj07G0126200 [Ziziphus jujuba var. spinosa]|uniref:F-box domain-containing protein n=1 Tax=Ziziphus jujuba var. spinosa TaxID=714518 RepID=A0A978V4N9_ZIZJJ|nr:hypothetical protein FEM48_Zijuj07G0126200 [Ziziphus jujuba var. spinosa]
MPSEILELILEKLPIADIARFKSVCSLWNGAAQSTNCSRFFSLRDNNNKDYKHVKNLFGEFGDGAWCVGYTRGWLVVLDEKLILHLLNPFSGAKIQLPRIPQYLQKPGMLPKDYVRKAILFWDPCGGKGRNSNFTLVVAFRRDIKSTRLAFCNCRLNKWIHFGRDNHHYLDIVGDSQRQLYALTNKALQVWNFQRRGGAYPKLLNKV